MNNKGFSIIEAIIAISFIAMVAITIGYILGSLSRISSMSLSRAEALSYAEESMELVIDKQNDLFSCACDTDSCGASTCTRYSDGQSCGLFEAYSSCWTLYPKNQIGNESFYFLNSSGVPVLTALGVGEQEIIPANNRFSRIISIENALCDSNGDISETGNIDNNTKFITVTVQWNERGIMHSVNVKTMLTSWKNL